MFASTLEASFVVRANSVGVAVVVTCRTLIDVFAAFTITAVAVITGTVELALSVCARTIIVAIVCV